MIRAVKDAGFLSKARFAQSGHDLSDLRIHEGAQRIIDASPVQRCRLVYLIRAAIAPVVIDQRVMRPFTGVKLYRTRQLFRVGIHVNKLLWRNQREVRCTEAHKQHKRLFLVARFSEQIVCGHIGRCTVIPRIVRLPRPRREQCVAELVSRDVFVANHPVDIANAVLDVQRNPLVDKTGFLPVVLIRAFIRSYRVGVLLTRRVFDAFSCGSRSRNKIRLPSIASDCANATADVVFATPPF